MSENECQGCRDGLLPKELSIEEWHDEYLKLAIYAVALVDEVEKLHELVRDIWRFTGAACKKYPRLFDPSAQRGQMVQLNMIDAFEQRMRELGIEVGK